MLKTIKIQIICVFMREVEEVQKNKSTGDFKNKS